VHDVQLGGGVKLPTGQFKEADNAGTIKVFSWGTGSWDYLLLTEYVIKRKSLWF
jgi:hypothetical protein